MISTSSEHKHCTVGASHMTRQHLLCATRGLEEEESERLLCEDLSLVTSLSFSFPPDIPASTCGCCAGASAYEEQEVVHKR